MQKAPELTSEEKQKRYEAVRALRRSSLQLHDVKAEKPVSWKDPSIFNDAEGRN